MPTLPNPFEFTGTAGPPVDKAVTFSPSTPVLEVAADPFDGPDIPLDELAGRGFSVAAFLNAMVPPLHADELIPVLRALAGDSFMADIEPIRAAIARH